MGRPGIPIKADVLFSFLSLMWCYHSNLHNTGKPGVHQRLCTVAPDHPKPYMTLFPRFIKQQSLDCTTVV